MIRTRERRAMVLPARQDDATTAMTEFDSMFAEAAALMCALDVPAGKVLTVEGAVGKEALLIVEGTAEVRTHVGHVTYLGPGEIVGEMALLNGQPRTATVRAVTPMRVLVMDSSQFGHVFEHPERARWLASALSKRLRLASAAVQP